MSPRTLALPPTDAGMWRRLLARAHPDGGGEGLPSSCPLEESREAS